MEPGEDNSAEIPTRIIPKFTSFKPPQQLAKSQAPIPKLLEVKRPVEAESSTQSLTHHKSRHTRRDRSRSRSRDRHRHRRHDRSGSRDRERDERRSRHRDKDRIPTSKHQDRRHRSRSRDREHSHNEQKKQNTATPGGGEILPWDDGKSFSTLVWAFDRKGDPANITYGTIHRYSIPSYYRSGQGRIVGLPKASRIYQDKGDGKGLVLGDNGQGQGEYKRGSGGERRYLFAVPKGVKQLRVITEKADGSEVVGGEFERGLEYVPLSRAKKRKREGSDEEDEREAWGIRTILGTNPSLESRPKPDDEDLEYDTSASEEDELSIWGSSKVRQRTIELQRNVEANPSDVEAWLKLVVHQDDVLYSERVSGRRVTIAEKQSTAEIKMSIIEKALDKAEVGVDGKEKLWKCYFSIGESTWEPNKLLTKYQQVLRRHPTMHGIWVQYLNFRQTDFASFKYGDMVTCFEDCLDILRQAIFRQGDNGEGTYLKSLEMVILYVITRGLKFTWEAGFMETAVGAVQALLELNFFPPENSLQDIYPPTSQEDHESALSELETFWDSEVLRIGEPSSKGWGKYIDSEFTEGTVPEPASKDSRSEEPSEIDLEDPFGSWVEKEQTTSSGSTGGFPSRTIDEVEEEDPYKVVLFSDIKKWMVVFRSESTKKHLVDTIIQLCGLPAWICAQDTNGGDWSRGRDILLTGNDLGSQYENWFWPDAENKQKLITWEGMEPERQGGLGGNAFAFKLEGGYPVTEDMLFGRGDGEWAAPLSWIDSGTGNLTSVRLIRGVLQALIKNDVLDTDVSERLALLYLAIEWRLDPGASKKIAKSLLKQFRQSILLWNAYAQIEWRQGNVDAARNVFSTASKMSKSFPEARKRDVIMLLKTWAWEEIWENRCEEALKVLLSIPEAMNASVFGDANGGVSKTMLLKARRYLQQEQARLLSLRFYNHAVFYNEALALLEYLSPIINTPSTPNSDVSAAIPIYDSLLSEMKERGLSSKPEYEIALMNGKVRLLYHHSRTSRLFRISLLREALEEAITNLAQSGGTGNSVLWSLYAWNEGRSKIEGRLRGWLREKILGVADKDATVMGWEFSIWAELRMGGGSVHVVRELFERAVECESTKASIALWKQYVVFELRERNPARAKMVFFRALKSCTWSKDIAMLGFTKLFSALDFEELNKTLSIVTSEKELRMRDTVDLENALEDLGEDKLRAMYPGISPPDVSTKRKGKARAKGKLALQFPDDGSSGEEIDRD